MHAFESQAVVQDTIHSLALVVREEKTALTLSLACTGRETSLPCDRRFHAFWLQATSTTQPQPTKCNGPNNGVAASKELRTAAALADRLCGQMTDRRATLTRVYGYNTSF
jgi:hypothetical protein